MGILLYLLIIKPFNDENIHYPDPHPLYRHSFGGWWHLWHRNRDRSGLLVLDNHKTLIQSAKLPVWAGLDDLVHSNGYFVVPRLEVTRGRCKDDGHNYICNPVDFEFCLEFPLLLLPASGFGVDRDRDYVGGHPGDDLHFLQN